MQRDYATHLIVDEERYTEIRFSRVASRHRTAQFAAAHVKIGACGEGGVVRIIGRVAGGEVLVAPLSGRRCVYYEAVIDEYRSSGKSGRWVERVREVRSTRAPDPWRRALEEVSRSARDGGNLVPPIIDAVEARATVGEIADSMRTVFGEHEERAAL